MSTATHSKRSSIDERYSRSIQISGTRQQWDAVRLCIVTAQEKCQDSRKAVCEPFLARLDKTLKAYKPPKVGDEDHGIWMQDIPVDGRVSSWVMVAELLLSFGDETAKGMGTVIVPACSKVVFGRAEDDAT